MGSQKSGQRETTKPKIQTVAEIEREYPDEWILLEITRDAKDSRRVAGRLLAHSRDRADLSEPYDRFRADHPDTRVYRFVTGGEKIPEGVVVILERHAPTTCRSCLGGA
jgi:hypothetical protein